MCLVTEPHRNHFLLSGKVSLTNIMAVRREFDARLPTACPVTVDLSELEVEGSAVLTLLVHIMRSMQQSGGSVRFENPGAGLRKIASLAGVLEILSLENT